MLPQESWKEYKNRDKRSSNGNLKLNSLLKGEGGKRKKFAQSSSRWALVWVRKSARTLLDMGEHEDLVIEHLMEPPPPPRLGMHLPLCVLG